MTYANIVSTLALVVGVASLWWQYYTWKHKKKQDEKPQFEIYIETRRPKDGTIKIPFSICSSNLIIRNIGSCGVIITSCSFDSIPIDSCNLFPHPQFVGVELHHGNSASCQMFSMTGLPKDKVGKKIDIQGKVIETGKDFHDSYPLYERFI